MNKDAYPMPKNINYSYGCMSYLSNMYKYYMNVIGQKIVFDFTYTKIINNEMLAVLGIIFTKLKSRRNQVLLRGLSIKLRKLFIDHNFIHNQIPSENTSNYISYNTFNVDNKDEFREYLFYEMSSIENYEVEKFLVTHIMEIFLNIRVHARNTINKSRFGNKEVFSSGYYNMEKNTLIISICNNGNTFAENILKKSKIEFLKESEYIKWALEKCNSTTSNRPGGAGLAMVKNLLSCYNGELTICSGKGYYSISYDENNIKTEVKNDLQIGLPLTIVLLKIPTDKINEVIIDRDEEFAIEELL